MSPPYEWLMVISNWWMNKYYCRIWWSFIYSFFPAFYLGILRRWNPSCHGCAEVHKVWLSSAISSWQIVQIDPNATCMYTCTRKLCIVPTKELVCAEDLSQIQNGFLYGSFGIFSVIGFIAFLMILGLEWLVRSRCCQILWLKLFHFPYNVLEDRFHGLYTGG